MNAFNASASTPSHAPHINRSELNVLLVDDDPFQLDLMTDILRGLGMSNITQASSGAQALQAMSNKHPLCHLLIMDLHMPGMDGFQFMESVAREGFSGALIIVSGQSADVMRAATLVAQLRRFSLLGSVHKPVSRAALSELIAKLP